jgi:YbbR domain-containing protein
VRAFLRALFLENLALKVVALSLAITLYVLVRGEKDAQTGGFVKVIYKYPAERVLMTDPPDRVRVSVRGPWSKVHRFDERELQPILVDLGGVTSGEFKFQEDMVKLTPGLRVVSFNPPAVRLEFEPRVTRTITVKAMLDGSPAPGFRVEATEIEPSAISVSGAQSVVDILTQIATEPVRVAGSHGQVVRVVELRRMPRHAELVDDDRVRVTVRVVPEIGERVLSRVSVAVVGGPPPSKVQPSTVEIVVRGPRAALDSLSSAPIAASIDVRELEGRPPGNYPRRVAVGGLADGLSAEARPATVLVTIARR